MSDFIRNPTKPKSLYRQRRRSLLIQVTTVGFNYSLVAVQLYDISMVGTYTPSHIKSPVLGELCASVSLSSLIHNHSNTPKQISWTSICVCLCVRQSLGANIGEFHTGWSKKEWLDKCTTSISVWIILKE